MKKCKTCEIEKDESNFGRRKGRENLEGSCKECVNKRKKEYVDLNREKNREKVRLRSEQRRQDDKWKEWRKDHQKRNRSEISRKALEDYYKKNRLQKQKIWKSKNKDKLRKYTSSARKKFPFKSAARAYVRAAIKDGIIFRPKECSRCFKECKSEAHHEHYMKPLCVIWLCRSCHGKEHRKHKEI